MVISTSLAVDTELAKALVQNVIVSEQCTAVAIATERLRGKERRGGDIRQTAGTPALVRRRRESSEDARTQAETGQAIP